MSDPAALHHRRLRRLGCLAVAAATLTLAACGEGEPPPAGAAPPARSGTTPRRVVTVDDVKVATTRVARVSGIPTALTAHPDGTELLVTQVTGQVRRIALEQVSGHKVPRLVDDEVLDLTGVTKFDGQNQGLLGLAFSKEGDRLLTAYTALDGSVTVESFPYEPGATVEPDAGTVILSVSHPLAGLSGGNITVSDSGDLFIGIGDMDVKTATVPTAQDPTSRLGSIVRIDEADLAGPDAVDGEVVAKGIRNPWGITVDPESGDIWFGDVGEARTEEFNRIPGEQVGDRVPNFGWPYLEGADPAFGDLPEGLDVVSADLLRSHVYEVCGAVGGVVSTGKAVPRIFGAYVYGDLCSNSVRAHVPGRDGADADAEIGSIDETVVAFGEGADGAVYALGAEGGVFRIDPHDWRPGDVETPRPSGTSYDGEAPREPTPSAPAGAATPPLELCAIIDSFIALDDLQELDPEPARIALAEAIRRAGVAMSAVPPELRADLETLQRSYNSLALVAESVAWDTEHPTFIAAFEDALYGRGQFAGLPTAINHIIDAQIGCPGRRL